MKKDLKNGSETSAAFEDAPCIEHGRVSMGKATVEANDQGLACSESDTTKKKKLSDDIVRGAMNIAELLFGERSKRARRAVYHLATSSQMPFFKMGSTLCIRRSKLEEYIAEQERDHPKR
jgi:hypothetical protein